MSVACRCEYFVSTSGPEAEREAFVGAEAVGGEVNLHVMRFGEEGRGRRCVAAERPHGFRRGLNLEKKQKKKKSKMWKCYRIAFPDMCPRVENTPVSSFVA